MRAPDKIVLTLLLTMGVQCAHAQATGIKSVYVKNSEIVAMDKSGHSRQLTNDGLSKSFPVWSKDGAKIAFIRGIGKGVALGDVVVIDGQNGQTLSNVLVRPIEPGVGQPLLSLERVEWLATDEIAATAGVNPSTVDAIVVDTSTGKEVTDYTDDQGGPVFSPDGHHAASITGIPHWTTASDTRPELDIDHKRVYPVNGVHVYFVSSPAWSGDSNAVAIVVQDYDSKKESIVICQVHGGCRTTAIPDANPNSDQNFVIEWNGTQVYATSPDKALTCQFGDSEAIKSSPPPGGTVSAADELLSGLKKQIEKLGGHGADFWCANCVLISLPRRNPRD